jgi:hypothetical protein
MNQEGVGEDPSVTLDVLLSSGPQTQTTSRRTVATANEWDGHALHGSGVVLLSRNQRTRERIEISVEKDNRYRGASPLAIKHLGKPEPVVLCTPFAVLVPRAVLSKVVGTHVPMRVTRGKE